MQVFVCPALKKTNENTSYIYIYLQKLTHAIVGMYVICITISDNCAPLIPLVDTV